MADTAQSILDRLKIKARQSGKGYQLHLQLFCQEEFLRRVQRSRYFGNLVLKGGLLLYCLSEFEARPTMDVDFMLQQLPNDMEKMKEVVQEIISEDHGNDFMRFEINSIEPIAEHREYNGVRVKLLALIKSTRTPFHVDMGVGDVIIPKSEVRKLPTQLSNFVAPEVLTYSLESTIAEKFDAIIVRMELGSRMKDYYDIYYLANRYTFDARTLQEAVFATLQKRGTNYAKDTMDKVYAFAENPDMQKKWQHFAQRTMKISLELNEVLRVIQLFIGPIFQAIISEAEMFGKWNVQTMNFK